MSAILSSGTFQTVLVIAGPLLLPRIIGAARAYFNRRKQHPGLPPPRRVADSVRLALFRLLVGSIGVCFCLLIAAQPQPNVFLPPASSLPERLLPLLRPTLALHTPIVALSANYARALGRPLTSQDQHTFLATCSSLDARKLYLAFGSSGLVNCSWCRPDGHGARVDLLAWLATELALVYLVLGGMMAALVSGERGRWRKWVVGLLSVAFGAELWWRLTWSGPENSRVPLLHTSLHVARYALFALLFLACYYTKPRLIPYTPTASTLLEPALIGLGNQAESLLHRIRVTSLQRMAIFHHRDFRGKVVDFWSNAESESEVAREDERVAKAIQARVDAVESAAFREWMSSALAVEQPSPVAPPEAPQ